MPTTDPPKPLLTKIHPPISTNNTPRTPRRILRTQHGHHPGNLMRIARPPARLRRVLHILLLIDALPRSHQRRILNKRPQLLLELRARTAVHLRRHGAGVNSVDSGALGELARPRARHRFERGFAAAVDALAYQAGGGRDGGDADDAAGAVVRQVRERGLDEQERPEHVDVVQFVEFGDGRIFDGRDDGHAGVVDDDVDGELARFRVREVVFCRGD